jgi:hypothetical protein
MAESVFVDRIREICRELIRTEGPSLLEKDLNEKIERAVEVTVGTEVTRALHKALGEDVGDGDPGDTPAKRGGGARKKRPRCEKCGKAMRKLGPDEWACKKC